MEEAILTPVFPDTPKRRVVIAGGGFAGLEFCKAMKYSDFEVILLDRHNYHTFLPLLYQVATGGLEPDSIAYPFRKFFKNYRNLHFRLAKIIKVEPENNLLYTNIGTIKYDHLVLATGSKTNFYGLENIQKRAFRLKSIPQALDLRSIILQNFEESLLLQDKNLMDENINIVIVGGGATGVETAGALGELKKYILPLDYPELDIRKMQIHVVEAGDRLISGMSAVASEKALGYLRNFDINIWLSTSVSDYDGKIVYLGNGKTITSRTVIWAAGVSGNAPEGFSTEAFARGNRIKVNRFCKVMGTENIYAIGDLAHMEEDDFPTGHPMVAQVAMQQGRFLARFLIREAKNKISKPFKYNEMGSMATVGRNRAVVDLPGFKFQGTFAWFVWMFVHLMSLVGFRNRIIVLIDWFWNYISYDRALRLIIRPYKRNQH